MIRDLTKMVAVALALGAVTISAQTASAAANRDDRINTGFEGRACIALGSGKLDLVSVRASLEQQIPERRGDFEPIHPDQMLA